MMPVRQPVHCSATQALHGQAGGGYLGVSRGLEYLGPKKIHSESAPTVKLHGNKSRSVVRMQRPPSRLRQGQAPPAGRCATLTPRVSAALQDVTALRDGPFLSGRSGGACELQQGENWRTI
jgi:hypothetical protein